MNQNFAQPSENWTAPQRVKLVRRVPAILKESGTKKVACTTISQKTCSRVPAILKENSTKKVACTTISQKTCSRVPAIVKENSTKKLACTTISQKTCTRIPERLRHLSNDAPGVSTAIRSAAGTATASSTRGEFNLNAKSKCFTLNKNHSNPVQNQEEHPFQIKPKIIAVLKSGPRPRKAVRVLLNCRNTKSFGYLLDDLTISVKLDKGTVRKILTLDGKPVASISDFVESEVFIACGGYKCSNEEFYLDKTEFRNVLSILGSPALEGRSRVAVKRKALPTRYPSKEKVVANTATSPACQTRNGPSSVVTATTASSVKVGLNQIPCTSQAIEATDNHIRTPAEVSNKYNVGDMIGDGNFAVVRKCQCKRTRQTFALKIIDKSKYEHHTKHMIESEIAILNIVCHPRIVELFEVFEYPDEKYLVTEFVPGGDLFDAIASDVKYSEYTAANMLIDIALALQYLHQKSIVHRDVKPENFFIESRKEKTINLTKHTKISLKLGDFGLARQITDELVVGVCGTPAYVAPEVLESEMMHCDGYGIEIDIWSAGVIAFILLSGETPFSPEEEGDMEEITNLILTTALEFQSEIWVDISNGAKHLITQMLTKDRLQRPSARDILAHRWIKKFSRS